MTISAKAKTKSDSRIQCMPCKGNANCCGSYEKDGWTVFCHECPNVFRVVDMEAKVTRITVNGVDIFSADKDQMSLFPTGEANE